MRTIKHTVPFLLLLAACGTDHDVDVSGGTQNEARLVVEYAAEICEDERFTAEEKLECIRLLTRPEVEAKVLADELSPEQLDELLGIGE